MKKLTIFIIFLLISNTSISNASFKFGTPSPLDLYKNIDEGINQLEDKMESVELKGGKNGKGILAEINKSALINNIPVCLDESKQIKKNDFDEIVKEKLMGNKSGITKYFTDKCLKNLSHEIVVSYIGLFKEHNNRSILTAKQKASQIYKISKIGFYADGDEENSGFDLIADIAKIDKIIFADVIDYEGKPIDTINKAINDFLDPLNKEISKLTTLNLGEKEKVTPIINNPIQQNNSSQTPNITETSNEYNCIPSQINNNGLSTDELDGIINNINYNIKGSNHLNEDINKQQGDNIKGLDPISSNIKSGGKYKKVNDNSEWPCKIFFCIKIDMLTYQYNLFGGGENITIEYLLNRSNKHLAKHAATSLIPAKMGTNNFEIGLKDINLPDLFHLSFQISSKPIPILKLENNSKKDAGSFSAKNMLESHYKSKGLNYKRRNDLNLLVGLENEKQGVNNSNQLSTENLFIKQQQNNEYARKRQEKAATLMKAIDNKVSMGILGTFEEQFTELDKFTVGINNYTNTLLSLIRKLNEIPIEQ